MVNSIKPIISAARLIGSTPLKITRNNVSISKIGIIYSAILSMTMLFVCVIQINFIFNLVNRNTLILTILRKFCSLICIVADVIFTIINYEELKSAIDHIHVYDVAAKFNNKNNNLTLINCRIVGLITLCVWLPVFYVSYKAVNYCPLLEAFSHYLFYASITSQILLFYGFMMSLYRRFNHLNQLVVKKEWMMEMKIQTLSGTWDGLKLQNVWLMHSNLSTAAEKINNCYSVQLLLWIMIFSLSVLTRLYTIMNYKENLMYVVLRDTICGLGVFLNLFLIIFSCHITSFQANKIVDKIFSPESAIQRHSNTIQVTEKATMYFRIKKLRFTGAYGFFHIHLPLLLSIVGGITTYLVILSKSS